MNRKIFTFLAVAFMLSMTAYYANARSVAETSVGALVKTLKEGKSLGMYHIQVDSICLRDGTGSLKWFPVTYQPGTTHAEPRHLQYNPGTPGTLGTFSLNGVGTSGFIGDTIVLAVTEAGQVRMISAHDLRREMSEDRANLSDLQASMWCIDLEIAGQKGQMPTLHFTNKIFHLDLDWMIEGETYVGGEDKGWMYTYTYTSGQLQNKMPLFRQVLESTHLTGEYLVISSQLENDESLPTGTLWTRRVTHEEFVDYGGGEDTVAGMIKVSIVGISPFVLTAEDFNTYLGERPDGKVELLFSPGTTLHNHFADPLRAYKSANAQPGPLGASAQDLGYLNIEAFDKTSGASKGFIVNSNKNKEDEEAPGKYNNDYATQYLNLLVKDRNIVQRGDDVTEYNHSYRFIYFPTEDSVVINAYYVKHDSHTPYSNIEEWDSARYDYDRGGVPYYYGLYNDAIHAHLTVRLQDLVSGTGDNDVSMMTINTHPGKTRISFDLDGCQAMIKNIWRPNRGVYTIWDSKGRCLGVRIYNGSLTPQWIELDEGECPDRIPSYQWAIEPMDNGNSQSRVMITNREFGDMTSLSSDLVQMKNVLILKDYSRIFSNQSQFNYLPLIPQYGYGQNLDGYEPITRGLVKGEYLNVQGSPSDCNVGGRDKGKLVADYSGFRPVIREFLEDPFLGYKHFEVEKDVNSASFGKSEDTRMGKGMDYNAYSFNYLSYLDQDNMYIDLDERYTEQILRVKKDNKTPFQFMLPDAFKPHCQEEPFGYPRTNLNVWTNMTMPAEGIFTGYYQNFVPLLKRYYYELKVADFYNFRDGLAEQFIVLKGAKADGSERYNSMFYGVADIYALKEPFKITNIYLRESQFITRPDIKENEERHPQDQTRRIYYAVLDRINPEQLQTVTKELGEVSESLMNADGTSKYNLVGWDVDYQTAWIKAYGKVVTATNIAVFSLENYNYELYRRLRSKTDDNAVDEGDGVDFETGRILKTNLDAPKTLRIYRDFEPADFLYEDGLSSSSYAYPDINFLGVNNSFNYKEEPAPDGTVKYNYHLFIDTAYINRGTGPIKPQYLIAVGPEFYNGGKIPQYDDCEEWTHDIVLQPYIRARYLVNATDSAREVGSDGDKAYNPYDKRYIYDTDWDRLAFVDAVHIHDRLYIMSEVKKYLKEEDYYYVDPKTKVMHRGLFDGDKLYKATEGNGGLAGKARTWRNSKMLGAYYDFNDWQNYHNDVCFSFRFRQPNVKNPNVEGVDTHTNDQKRFYIESETFARMPWGNPKIAPVQGGWIMIQNHVPVLSRSSYHDQIQQGEVFNVAVPTSWQSGQATENEQIVAKEVNVVAGVDVVTVYNAAGKQVTIVNMLGQTIAKKVLAGNNEPISVPKGIAVVNIEGEKTVKVIVK